MSRRFSSLGAGLFLALLAAFTVGLSAHLAVAKTMPANESTVAETPARVRVWFTQQPSPRVSLLTMKGPGGDVPLGELEVNRQDRSIAAAVGHALAPGSYEVTWRTAGDDGHVMRGTFTFAVKPTE
jgi:methionine-rich copper-binding protein CopC